MRHVGGLRSPRRERGRESLVRLAVHAAVVIGGVVAGAGTLAVAVRAASARTTSLVYVANLCMGDAGAFHTGHALRPQSLQLDCSGELQINLSKMRYSSYGGSTAKGSASVFVFEPFVAPPSTRRGTFTLTQIKRCPDGRRAERGGRVRRSGAAIAFRERTRPDLAGVWPLLTSEFARPRACAPLRRDYRYRRHPRAPERQARMTCRKRNYHRNPAGDPAA